MKQAPMLIAAVLVVALSAVVLAESTKDVPKGDPIAPFLYPAGTVWSSGGSATVRKAGVRTTDPLEAVIDYYSTLFGQSLQGDCVHGDDKSEATTTCVNDSFAGEADGAGDSQPRPVSIRVATHTTQFYTVTVVMSRAEGEPETHIVLNYVKR